MKKKTSTNKTEKIITMKAAAKLLRQRLSEASKKLTKLGIGTAVSLTQNNDNGDSNSFNVYLSLTKSRKKLLLSPGGQYHFGSDSTRCDTSVDSRMVPVITISDFSRKHRQAVLLLTEPARVIKKTVRVDNFERPSEILNSVFVNNIGITLPRRTKYEVTNRKSEKGTTEALVTAKVPATSTCFLIGYDEHHMFVSMLKRKVSTVEQAHDELMPKEIKGRTDYVRQGEFFFVPATQREIEGISSAELNYSLDNDNGDSTDHVATVMAYSSAAYDPLVSGSVFNPRHATLFLSQWMRVVVNNENPGDGNGRWD